MSIEAMKQWLEALEKVTKELLAIRDEIAERGGRPTTNVFHQRLWDSSFNAYIDHAIPAANSLRQAIAEAEKQEPVAVDAEMDNVLRRAIIRSGKVIHPQPRKPLTDEQENIINFLLGASDIDNVWFGDKHPTEKGQFWWRNKLRKAFQEADKGIKE